MKNQQVSTMQQTSVVIKVAIMVILFGGAMLGVVQGILLFNLIKEPVELKKAYVSVNPYTPQENPERINPYALLIKTSSDVNTDTVKQKVINAFASNEKIINSNKTSIQLFDAQKDRLYATPEELDARTDPRDTNVFLEAESTVDIVSAEEIKLEVDTEATLEKNGTAGIPDSWHRVEFNIPVNAYDISRELRNTIAEFETVQPEFLYTSSFVPNDTYYSSSGSFGQPFDDMWGLKDARMNTETAWDATLGDPSIIVAVSDTGVDYTHPDIDDNIWTNEDEIPDNGIDDDNNGYVDDIRGWNFIDCEYYNPNVGRCIIPSNDPNDPKDLNGHGTHVAGTIAAEGDNNMGIIGVCPECTIMPVRVLNSWGGGSTPDLVAGLYYAAENGADIINMSWGGSTGITEDDVLLQNALDDIKNNYGVVLVAAAGNDGWDTKYYLPAKDPNVITVAATDYTDKRAWFSNYGSAVDVAAPGVDILSLRAAGTDMYGNNVNVVDDNYLIASGTSMATPHIAGLAGLLLSANPSLTPDDVQAILEYGSEDINASEYAGWDIYLGSGRSNAFFSMNEESGAPVFSRIQTYDDYLGYTIGDPIDIQGLSYGPEFAQYHLEYAPTSSPDNWTEIAAGTTEIPSTALLGILDTSNLFGSYIVRLTTQSISGGSSVDSTIVTVAQRPGWPKDSFDNNAANWLWDYTRPETISFAGDTHPWISYGFQDSWDGRKDTTIIDADGNPKPGWPQSFYSSGQGGPVVGDINGDGVDEMVYLNEQNEIWAKNSDGSDFQASPIASLDSSFESHEYIVLADVDTTVAGLEIIVSMTEYKDFEDWFNDYVYIFHSDGSAVSGWPVVHQYNWSSVSEDTPAYYQVPSVGNIDSDPEVELVWAGLDFTLNAYNHDGTPVTFVEEPHLEFVPFDPITLGDMDGDGIDEILVTNPLVLQIFNGDGTAFPFFPESFGYAMWSWYSLLPTDVDGDGAPEIVATGMDYYRGPFVSVFRRNGELMNDNWPRYIDFVAEPNILDIDNDSKLEILVGNQLFDDDGSYIEQWPYQAAYRSAFVYEYTSANSLIDDFDSDGNYELFYKDAEFMFMWDLEYSVTNNTAWQAPYGGTEHQMSIECDTCSDTTYAYDTRTKPCNYFSNMCTVDDNPSCASGSCNQTTCRCNPIIPYQNGWPKVWAKHGDVTPVVADLNNDGSKEVLVSQYLGENNLLLHAYQQDGIELPGWPIQLVSGEYMVDYSAYLITDTTTGDLDGDGINEVIVYAMHQFYDQGNFMVPAVLAFHSDGSFVDGFPVDLENSLYDAYMSTISVREFIDNLDHPGTEIILSSRQWAWDGSKHAVHVMYSDGTTAWVGDHNLDADTSIGQRVYFSNHVVEDVDYDGDIEVALITELHKGWEDIERYITIWNSNGEVEDTIAVPGIGSADANFLVGDIDKAFNGLEFIFGEEMRYNPNIPDREVRVYAVHADGTPVEGWPATAPDTVLSKWGMFSLGTTAGDIDNDGQLEVVSEVFDDRWAQVFIWEHNGVLKNTFDMNYGGPWWGYYQAQPLLVDVDNDGQTEIVSADYNWLNAWNLDGTIAEGFPINTYSYEGMGALPAFDDLDGDQDMEIVLTDGGALRVYDMAVTWNPDRSPWPQFLQSADHRSFVGEYPACDNGNVAVGICNANNEYCTAQGFVTCDDGNSCTTESCVEGSTCQSTPVPNDCGNRICGQSPNGCYSCGTCDGNTPYCDDGQCIAACSDGTLYGECNASRQYCNYGTFVSGCSYCGATCPTGYSCSSNKCCKKVGGSYQCIGDDVTDQAVPQENIR